MPITIINDMRRLLDCRGVTLESVFVEAQEPRDTVLVYHVDPGRSSVKTVSPVVKFSEKRFAIPRAEHLKLSTPSYYREYEEDTEGIRDDLEAKYRGDVRSFLSKYGTLDARSIASLSGRVTYSVDNFWMFCTSQKPTSTRGLEQIRKRFSAECVTTIPDPSEFAQELGAAFASHSSWSGVDLGALDECIRKLRPSEIGDKVVWVYHGPVFYSDDSQKLVESFDDLHRPAVVSFLKRRMFAWQKEYRFTVKINGKPRETQFLLPITQELRGLSEIEWATPDG